MQSIEAAKHKQVRVLIVIGSFITRYDSNAKIMAPTENPINRPGQVAPPKADAQYCVK